MGLTPQPELPNALHAEPLGVNPAPRKISIEEAVMFQIDRIGYLRSIGEPWDEPVYHLRDMIVGLEDSEFWDGIPMNMKKEGIGHFKLRRLQKRYGDRGWEGLLVRHNLIDNGDGTYSEVMDPTNVELSRMLRIIMALLARRGMTWRRKTVDEIPSTFEGDTEYDLEGEEE